MKKYRIIGNMTGNSMDAIDLVFSEFCGEQITDICSYSKPFTKEIQQDIKKLRDLVAGKTKQEIDTLSFFHKVHDEYIQSVAECINEMCNKYDLNKKSIDAIGFHGKTLDHNPPSKAILDNTIPYTLQMGSGQMLANLTNIPVVYDFRSAPIMSGFEGAPLIAPHNVHIAKIEGDGCYYNGGNTSNYTWITDGKAVFSTDSGPCNEYIDNYIRSKTNLPFDIDGKYGAKGNLNTELLQKLFDIGRDFYEIQPPKSGDPQYYQEHIVTDLINNMNLQFEDIVKTLEYFAAYIAMYGVSQTPQNIKVSNNFILFGGAWKNPIIQKSFTDLLNGDGYVLPQHKVLFQSFINRINKKINIKYSAFGENMEARMCADMAFYRLENRPWECPEFGNTKIICGIIATPNNSNTFTDKLNMAAKK